MVFWCWMRVMAPVLKWRCSASSGTTVSQLLITMERGLLEAGKRKCLLKCCGFFRLHSHTDKSFNFFDSSRNRFCKVMETYLKSPFLLFLAWGNESCAIKSSSSSFKIWRFLYLALGLENWICDPLAIFSLLQSIFLRLQFLLKNVTVSLQGILPD